jgi:hypothetical protein
VGLTPSSGTSVFPKENVLYLIGKFSEANFKDENLTSNLTHIVFNSKKQNDITIRRKIYI